MINLGKYGTVGVILFYIILLIFECLFCVIGYSVANHFHLTGFVWWIVAIAIFLILNMIFIRND